MIVAAFLLGYGLALAWIGPRLLPPLGAARRAPLLGILTWLIAQLSVVVCWLLGGMLLAVPDLLVESWLGQVFRFGPHPLRETVSGPHQAVQVAGGLLAAATLCRIGWCVTAALVTGHRYRRRHAEGIRVVGRRHQKLDCFVVDHGPAIAYCLPGRQRLIVVTRAALDALTRAELNAILGHERTHLVERHHIPSTVAGALARAFPLPLFTTGATAIRALLEMRADDVAARRHGRRTVGTALLSLAKQALRHPTVVSEPGYLLAAAEVHVLVRLERLLGAPQRWTSHLRARLQLLTCSAIVGFCSACALPVAAATAVHLVLCPPGG
ncbi:M56 family metallopeptidase [Amycolatopsis nigrescens]|uniref:M56 family metallopeptidase n=1 Tax=Amycolatopsis nigrescens TaxID=381445 RepID=UPI000380A588|nr:M56 family metallopeptidase [Amycolatopsis nigrescens]